MLPSTALNALAGDDATRLVQRDTAYITTRHAAETTASRRDMRHIGLRCKCVTKGTSSIDRRFLSCGQSGVPSFGRSSPVEADLS
jgi:hypothetical protein